MDVREKLIEIVKKAAYSSLPSNTEDFHLNMFVTNLLSHGVTVQEWVSVKDRLPDKTGRYLVLKNRIAPDCLGGNRTDIVILRFFVDKGFRMPTHIPDWINEEINEEVIYWMPLPKPPKGE